jgi:hypothetical protein
MAAKGRSLSRWASPASEPGGGTPAAADQRERPGHTLGNRVVPGRRRVAGGRGFSRPGRETPAAPPATWTNAGEAHPTAGPQPCGVTMAGPQAPRSGPQGGHWRDARPGTAGNHVRAGIVDSRADSGRAEDRQGRRPRSAAEGKPRRRGAQARRAGAEAQAAPRQGEARRVGGGPSRQDAGEGRGGGQKAGRQDAAPPC